MSKVATGIGGGFCGVPLLLVTTGTGAGVAAGEGESPATAFGDGGSGSGGLHVRHGSPQPVKLLGKKVKSAKLVGKKVKCTRSLRDWDLNSIVGKRKSKGEKTMHPTIQAVVGYA